MTNDANQIVEASAAAVRRMSRFALPRIGMRNTFPMWIATVIGLSVSPLTVSASEFVHAEQIAPLARMLQRDHMQSNRPPSPERLLIRELREAIAELRELEQRAGRGFDTEQIGKLAARQGQIDMLIDTVATERAGTAPPTRNGSQPGPPPRLDQPGKPRSADPRLDPVRGFSAEIGKVLAAETPAERAERARALLRAMMIEPKVESPAPPPTTRRDQRGASDDPDHIEISAELEARLRGLR